MLTEADIHETLRRYFVDGDRSEDVVQADEPETDADPSYARYIIDNAREHEPEFAIFSYFQDPFETILDVGANYGYSATSIWAAGSKTNIISFEPNRAYAPVLRELKNYHADKTGLSNYDFRTMAISDESGSLVLAMPVLNGKMLAALTTADKLPHIPSIARNSMYCALHYTDEKAARTFRMFEFVSPSKTLDEAISTENFCVPVDKVAAIKIDTEGLESRVLAGAPRILRNHQPLILAEGGSAIEPALRALDYTPAELHERHLRLVDTCPPAVNAVFVHPAHFDRYRSNGLLR